MIVENTENAKKIQRVVASMALENMYVSEDLIKKVMEADEQGKSYDHIRQELMQRYVR